MKLTEKALNGQQWLTDDGVWFYRQPGGCVEIGKTDDLGGPDDIVHIHTDDVPEFLRLLTEFVGEGK